MCTWWSITTKANPKDLAGFDSCTMDPLDPVWQSAQSFVIMTQNDLSWIENRGALDKLDAKFHLVWVWTNARDSAGATRRSWSP